MSERRNNIHRRSTSSGRVTKPSPSPSRRKIRPEKFLRPSRNNVKVLKRSKSEPSIWKSNGGDEAAEVDDDVGVLYRPLTCVDIFSPADIPATQSPEGYNKDAKVVVNVTVEGSPGPIRAMVKLGSNVDETIKLVVKKYNEEGRTPHLDQNAASKCELHHSYFSLESLSKSDLMADVGSRSFHLRRISTDHHEHDYINNSNNIKAAPNTNEKQLTSTNQLTASSIIPISIDENIKKIIRKTRKVCTFLGCIPCY